MTGMLRIIMDACNIRSFGVCDAAKFTPNEQGSIIAVLFPHKLPDGSYADGEHARRAAENILSVACEALTRAFGQYDFTAYLDDSPFQNELVASVSGLGTIGKPGWFISPQYGTDCFIGIITSGLYFPPTGNDSSDCEQCGLCSAACPTPEDCPHSQYNRNLPELPDCRLCRKACPHNASTQVTYIKAFN